MFEQEISPEELFNMFFGGGGAGGGPFFASSFGPGIRVQQFGGGGRPTGRRARNREPNRNSFTTTLFALLPLLFVLLPLITSLLSSLFFQAGSLYNTPEPEFRFSSTRMHPVRRHTQDYGIPYYINERDFDAAFKDNPRRLKQFERNVYVRYVHHLQEKCQLEIDNKRRRINQAQGWLGLMVDSDEMKKAQAIPLPSCDKLKLFK
ncbi:Chaperone protein dnaJ [Dispira parvispora]|uniref:Chaperone protein dnaJ n=1 Tax=Dispira parvispora TaxID=1520584 RepID=A0A9W8AP18_9FUNG|nr:Chaperone protein dnaJ [Dispira parvispora]